MDKKIALTIIIIIVAGSFLFVKNESSISGNVIQTEYSGNIYEATLKIDNMYCEACAYGVKAQLEELQGVVNADIDYKNASGIVIYDADIIDASIIADASTIYPATTISNKKL